MSAAPTTRNEKQADTTGLNIVMVDSSTRSQRENRVRSDKVLQKQQESKLLKELGGACFWCYRNKKKCDPSDPCPSCASNGYKCIRESTQLCLSTTAARSRAGYNLVNEFSRCLRDQALQLTSGGGIIIIFRQPQTKAVRFWVTYMSQFNVTQQAYVNEQLVSIILELIWSSELDRIEADSGSHPFCPVRVNHDQNSVFGSELAIHGAETSSQPVLRDFL